MKLYVPVHAHVLSFASSLMLDFVNSCLHVYTVHAVVTHSQERPPL